MVLRDVLSVLLQFQEELRQGHILIGLPWAHGLLKLTAIGNFQHEADPLFKIQDSDNSTGQLQIVTVLLLEFIWLLLPEEGSS